MTVVNPIVTLVNVDTVASSIFGVSFLAEAAVAPLGVLTLFMLTGARVLSSFTFIRVHTLTAAESIKTGTFKGPEQVGADRVLRTVGQRLAVSGRALVDVSAVSTGTVETFITVADVRSFSVCTRCV